MRTELSLFEQCRSALAAWHDGRNPADAARFERAFAPYCLGRVRLALGHREGFERYGYDAVQNIMIHFLEHRPLVGAESWGYWNTAISNEITETIDEVNAYRARRVLKGGKRTGNRFVYLGVDAQEIVPAGGAVDTPEASVEAAQTLRVVRGALKTLPPLRRWAYVARQAEPLYWVTRREITLQAKRLKMSRAALVALLKAHDPKSDEARLRLNYSECVWRGLKTQRVASLQRAVNRASADLQKALPHLAIVPESKEAKAKAKAKAKARAKVDAE